MAQLQYSRRTIKRIEFSPTKSKFHLGRRQIVRAQYYYESELLPPIIDGVPRGEIAGVGSPRNQAVRFAVSVFSQRLVIAQVILTEPGHSPRKAHLNQQRADVSPTIRNTHSSAVGYNQPQHHGPAGTGRQTNQVIDATLIAARSRERTSDGSQQASVLDVAINKVNTATVKRIKRRRHFDSGRRRSGSTSRRREHV